MRPSIVLLDIQLPVLSGFELAVEIADIQPRPVVVLTSSRAATAYGDALWEAPVRGFIAKGDLSGTALASLV